MKEAEMAIPHLFRCPISLDLFEDPVTLCTGQTYDRSSIEKWLALGNLTCPVTMQRLHDPSIVPNHTLRHLINQWLQLGPQFHPSYSSEIDSLASLKHSLESNETTLENKLQSLEKILTLSDESCSAQKSCFLELGFVPLLLELVFGRAESELLEDQWEFMELALSCILKLLPLFNSQPINMLQEESKLSSFIALFEQGSAMIKTSLCLLIESSSESNEVCSIFGKIKRLLNEITLLVCHNSEASDAGIRALSALSSFQSNTRNLVMAGAIDGIITYISNCARREKNMAPMAVATIEKLLVAENGIEALMKNPNGVNALVKMVFRVSDHDCSEAAVGSLLMVCGDSGCRAWEEAIAAGVLTQLLLLLQSQCSARTKTKARMLLKLLKSRCAEE